MRSKNLSVLDNSNFRVGHSIWIRRLLLCAREIKIELTLQAQSDIIMWRSFVLLLVAHPVKLSRSMGSFRLHPPQYCFKYDASLKRIAVGVYTADDDKLLVFAAVDLPFAVNNEARRQNTMEFLVIIFGLLLCWRTAKSTFITTFMGTA